MTPPPISQFHNPGYQQPISPVGTPNTVPQTVNPNPVPQTSSSQSAGQVVTGGDSSHKTAYPSSSPNPTSNISNFLESNLNVTIYLTLQARCPEW